MMTLGYRCSLNAVCLLAMFVIAHAAPIKSKRESGVYLSSRTQQFYCISELLKHLAKSMVEVSCKCMYHHAVVSLLYNYRRDMLL